MMMESLGAGIVCFRDGDSITRRIGIYRAHKSWKVIQGREKSTAAYNNGRG